MLHRVVQQTKYAVSYRLLLLRMCLKTEISKHYYHYFVNCISSVFHAAFDVNKRTPLYQDCLCYYILRTKSYIIVNEYSFQTEEIPMLYILSIITIITGLYNSTILSQTNTTPVTNNALVNVSTPSRKPQNKREELAQLLNLPLTALNNLTQAQVETKIREQFIKPNASKLQTIGTDREDRAFAIKQTQIYNLRDEIFNIHKTLEMNEPDATDIPTEDVPTEAPSKTDFLAPIERNIKYIFNNLKDADTGAFISKEAYNAAQEAISEFDRRSISAVVKQSAQKISALFANIKIAAEATDANLDTARGTSSAWKKFTNLFKSDDKKKEVVSSEEKKEASTKIQNAVTWLNNYKTELAQIEKTSPARPILKLLIKGLNTCIDTIINDSDVLKVLKKK